MNLDGNISDSRLVGYGVLQGSVVGPTLFSIYINDLPNTIGLEGMQKYADDTVLYGSDCNALQGKLNKAFEWCGKNILTLNSKKTQWMRVGSQQQKMKNQSVTFTIGNTQLVEVDSYKYLGLTLDSKLYYQIHRSNLTSKIHQKLNYFAKIRKYITVDSALIIYKATILPLLDHADYIYEQQIKYVNTQIQGLQNKGLRIVYNQHIKRFDERLSSARLHEMASIPKLKYRRECHLLQYAYEMKKDGRNIDNRLLPTRAHVGTRLRQKRILNNRYYMSLQYRAIDTWNRLPDALTMINSKHVFTKRVYDSYHNLYIEED